MRKTKTLVAVALSAGLLLAACGDDNESSTADTTATAEETTTAETTATGDGAVTADTSPDPAALAGVGNDCTKGKTLEEGVLTIGTGSPAYSPWVENDAPESGEGFEAAVAYLVAEAMYFSKENVKWVRTTFDEAIQPGAKNFDFNLQQYSITDERKKTVSFSDPYYTSNQAIVGFADSRAAGAKSVADLKDLKFGAQAGTTSLDFINEVIKPSSEPFVYDDNAGAKAALEAKQVDAIVLDLPTAFYVSAVEIEGTKVIGQFPANAGSGADEFGMVFDLDNPLVECVNTALALLKENDLLAAIETQWLSAKTGAPVIATE
ncbi:MAG: amino acid ABC transporter substrate-binding protein [Ilumatobacteraceae bacterium]|nr:amino acid ABC transporter substrate-binding protein [Ilumatobacteraceae bacterium]